MNRMLQQRAGIVATLRQEGKMTCPTSIGDELKTNPFLRPDSAEIRRNLKMEAATDCGSLCRVAPPERQFQVDVLLPRKSMSFAAMTAPAVIRRHAATADQCMAEKPVPIRISVESTGDA